MLPAHESLHARIFPLESDATGWYSSVARRCRRGPQIVLQLEALPDFLSKSTVEDRHPTSARAWPAASHVGVL